MRWLSIPKPTAPHSPEITFSSMASLIPFAAIVSLVIIKAVDKSLRMGQPKVDGIPHAMPTLIVSRSPVTIENYPNLPLL